MKKIREIKSNLGGIDLFPSNMKGIERSERKKKRKNRRRIFPFLSLVK